MNHPSYAVAAWVLRALIVAAGVREVAAGDWPGILSTALFLALSFAYHLVAERLPNLLDALVALAALLSTLGFVFDFYARIPLYDEVAHAITIFALTLGGYYLVYRGDAPRRSWVLGLAVLTFGIALGTVWEIAEWLAGRLLDTAVIYGLGDAVTDLMANSLGALVAAFAALGLHPDRDDA